MSNARNEILRRIRTSLRDIPNSEQASDVVVAREYRRTSGTAQPELVDRFVDRLVDYKAKVQRVSAAELPNAIAAACAARGIQRLVVPIDLPTDWIPTTIELVPDQALSKEQLDRSSGVLTGCTIGVAQTGTIILNGGAAQGRRAISLLPDYHLCVVFTEQIVDLVPEAIARLIVSGSQRKPITFISGPSATSDIELNRVEGVHGPRTLEVLIVESDLAH